MNSGQAFCRYPPSVKSVKLHWQTHSSISHQLKKHYQSVLLMFFFIVIFLWLFLYSQICELSNFRTASGGAIISRKFMNCTCSLLLHFRGRRKVSYFLQFVHCVVILDVPPDATIWPEECSFVHVLASAPLLTRETSSPQQCKVV